MHEFCLEVHEAAALAALAQDLLEFGAGFADLEAPLCDLFSR
jgi:hypothetical protein